MKPEIPPAESDAQEARLTALLLGELDDDQAAQVRKALESDPALTQLYHRLEVTFGFVREAVAETTPQSTNAPAPRLSDARRQLLLARFKTVPLPPASRSPESGRHWVLPLALAAALVLLVAVANLAVQPRSLERFAIVDRLSPAPVSMAKLDAVSSGVEPARIDQATERDLKRDLRLESRIDQRPLEERLSEAVVPPANAPTPDATEAKAAQAAPTPPSLTANAMMKRYGLAAGRAAAPATPAPAPATAALAMDDADTRESQRAVVSVRSASLMPDDAAASVAVTAPAVQPPAAPAAVGGSEGVAMLPATEVESAVRAQESLTVPAAGASPALGVNTRAYFAYQPAADTGALATNTAEWAIADVPLNDTTLATPRFGDNALGFGGGGGFGGSGGLKAGEDRTRGAVVPESEPALTTTGHAQELGRGLLQPAGKQESGDKDRFGNADVTNGREVLRGLLDPAGIPELGSVPELGKKLVTTAGEPPAARRPATEVNFQTGVPLAMVAAGTTAESSETNQRLREALGRAKIAAVAPAKAKPQPTPLTSVAQDAAAAKPAVVLDPLPELATTDQAFSTFSLNVTDVSFRLASASLQQGVWPDPATLRPEEFLNAFDYRDPEPPPGAPIGFTWDRARYPFAQNREVLRFALRTSASGRSASQPLNVVLLVDTSGSMERADRVRILNEALRVLVTKLRPQDRVSVVTFARTARLLVDGLPGDAAGQVADRLREMTPDGGTNLEDALQLAYATSLRHRLPNGINRVVLLTDGAANLGQVDPEALKRQVDLHRGRGVALDCFGIGWEGYNDDLLEVLARSGDGRYGFINTPEQAATDFAAQLAGALQVAAADVKVQVEFNPARVTAYRQVGYRKHQLTREQFRDNKVDAAEIGAAESGNALYVAQVLPQGEGPVGWVRVRFKVPATGEYQEHEWTVPYNGQANPMDQADPRLRLATSAASFAEWLAANPHAAEVTPDRLLALMRGVPPVFEPDARPRQLETMIREAAAISRP